MKNIIISIFLFASISFAQNTEKYFIYFTDKGIDKTTQLSKSSAEYNQAVGSLSERSIKRRMKTLGKDFITFEDLPLNQSYITEIENSGAKIVWKLKWFNAVSVFLTDEQYQQISKFMFVDKIVRVKKLKYKKNIDEEAKLNKLLKIEDSKSSLDYGASLTQNKLSDIPIVHDAGISGEGVLIGILDAGFAWKAHPALQSRNILAERDFVNGDENTDDGDASHGTAVFSLIGGFDEGNIVGPAYNAQFVLAKTEYIYTETHLEEDNYAAAMEWMDSIGVDITTTSLGYSEFDTGEGDYSYSDMDGKTTIVTIASELAFSRGILTINSAGNEGNNSWKYITAPSDGFNTISVGAVTSGRILASFSSVGPTFDGRIKPEIVAQGVSCYHARAYGDSSNSYGYGSGTSYSGPIAAGISAQLLSAYPYLSNEQMRSIIIEACDSTENPNNKYGYGLLSAKVAVEYPNLRKENDNYILNKMFVNEGLSDEDSVLVAIYDKRTDAIPVFTMEKNNNYYSFNLPNYPEGTELRISFSIERGDSSYFVDGLYSFVYGSLDILLGIDGGNVSPPSLPEHFELGQNYPNPFNPLTKFVLSVPEASFITVNIYNILGQKIKTLASQNFSLGSYSFSWDGSNDFGEKVSSGVYLYTAVSKSNVISKKMMYIK